MASTSPRHALLRKTRWMGVASADGRPARLHPRRPVGFGRGDGLRDRPLDGRVRDAGCPSPGAS